MARILLVVVMMAFAVYPVLGRTIGISTKLGSIDIPETWQVEYVSDDSVVVFSTDGLSCVTLIAPKDTRLSEYLHIRANELHISRYVRNVDRECQEKAGATSAGFVQGLIPLNNELAEVPDMSDWVGDNWKEVNGIPSRYLFVAAYKADGRLFVMEAETFTEGGSPMSLSEIQRSWKLP